MTVEKALAILDDLRAWNNTPPPDEEAVEALSLAISTLRAQQDAEKNEPLTLGELRQMDGEPVWVEPYLAVPDGWYLVDLTDMALRRRCDVPPGGPSARRANSSRHASVVHP